MEQNSQVEPTKKTIWVITEIDSGVVNGVYTNCKDLDIRAGVVDVDSDYEDIETMRLAQACLGKMAEAGSMSNIYCSPYWALLDPDCCLCTNRYPEGEYEFTQVCQLEDGGFGIAINNSDVVCLKDYIKEERIAFIEKAGYVYDDERFDGDLENVYVAMCVFKARLQEYIIPGLRFNTFWEARRHLALNCVDCFIAPEINYGDDTQSVDRSMPMCVDVEKALTGFDKETLVNLAVSYDLHTKNLSAINPDSGAFRLEDYLAATLIAEIKALPATSSEDHRAMRKRLDQMNAKKLAFAIIHYNDYLKERFREYGDISCGQSFGDYLKRLDTWFSGRPFWN